MPTQANKFARIQARNTGTTAATELIFTPGLIATALLFETTGKLQVSSGSTDDDVGGTGATSVELKGFDANGDEISEEIAMDGQTAVPSVNEYYCVTELRVKGAGSGGVNAGIIYLAPNGTAVASGVPNGSTKIAVIEVGTGYANMFQFRVPPGHKANVQVGAVCNDVTVQFQLQSKKPGEGWNNVVQFPANTSIAAHEAFPAGTVFRVRSIDGTGSNVMAAILDISILPR